MTASTANVTLSAARHLFAMVSARRDIAGLPNGEFAMLSDDEWTRLIELSNRNGVTSYVHQSLSERAGRDQSAQDNWQLLRGRALQVARRGLTLRADLIRILRRMEQDGIDGVALKGPLLADRYYKKPSLREFGDLDILVRPVDRDRAWAMLESLGYYTPYKNVDLDKRYHIVFHQNTTNEVVELHWRIAGPQFGVYYTGDFLWERSQRVQYCGIGVRVPTHEAQLLYLAIHAYKHDWARLQWLIDFREILKGDVPLDWVVLDNMARRQGAQRLLRATLQLVGLLFSDIVGPPPGHELAKPVLGARALRQVGHGLVYESSGWRAFMNFFLIRLNAAESMSVRRQLVRSVLAPSERDQEFIALPAIFKPLYFVVRPFRVLKKLLQAH